MHQKLQELLFAARSDPKKSGVLGVLMLVLIVMGAKHLVGGKPSDASAARNAVSAVHDELLGLSDIGAIVASGPSIEVPAGAGRMRDLFRFDDRHFPAPVEGGGDSERSAKSDDDSDDPTTVSADPEAIEARRIRDEAERFRLTSTLLGSNPIAVIDVGGAKDEPRSYMLRIGEDIRGFTLVSVSHRRAVIEQAGHRFTLEVE